MNSPAERDLSPVKRALLEIRELRAKLETAELAVKGPIAVIGIGCRLPGGVSSAATYWDLLKNGTDAIAKVPIDRWDADRYFDEDADAPGTISTRFGGFIGDVDKADPSFFGISPREAESMDPQQRVLLEVSWEAFEHAGLAADELRGSPTGVFIGIGTHDYLQLRSRAGNDGRFDAYYTPGSVSHSVASGRLAYSYGLTGPTMSVDTACSSSLVAIHLACQSLRSGECSLAIAGGVGIILAPDNAISLSKAHMLAPDGRCKTFDARANGFARGEGCGVIVLKRLADAQADGDTVLAVVRGTAVNQDGRSTGLTVPNGPAQEAVIKAALRNADRDARDVAYVEAHGTGTELGDPIEVQALAAALCNQRSTDQPLRIGSVKTNIGHLESAAGVAGFIKVVLALQHGEIPRQLHFEKPNPHIPWSEMPIEVVTEHCSWPTHRGRRVAGVSSFGFSGTNAHIVLEGAPVVPSTEVSAESAGQHSRQAHILAISAKTPDALQRLAGRYSELFASDSGIEFADVCYSANTGRALFPERLAVVAQSSSKASRQLANLDSMERMGVHRGTAPPDGARVAFLFSGQGAQHVGMGRALYKTQPAFRSALDACDELYRAETQQSVVDIIFGRDESNDDAHLNSTTYTQPALFAFEYALAELWRSWGVKPDWVVGHSVGEYVAACAAGIFSLEDAIRLVAARGRLMGTLAAGGTMAAVLAEESRVVRAIAECGVNLSIAAVNSPANVVVSGAEREVDHLLQTLSASGVDGQRLRVSHAFHSPLVDPVLDEFERLSENVTCHDPQVGIMSNLTGKPIRSASECGPGYWRRHAREPVRFQDAIRSLEPQADVFLEIGPHTTLAAMASACFETAPLFCGPSLRRGRDDEEQLLETLAELWVCGTRVDWKAFDGNANRRRVSLPTYPFARESYWAADAQPNEASPDDDQGRWRRAIAAARRQAEMVPIDLDPDSYPAKWEVLDRLTSAYTRRALYELGAFPKDGESVCVDELIDQSAVLSAHRKLLARWLSALSDEGWLEREGKRFVSPAALEPPSATDLAALETQAAATLHDVRGVYQFVLNSGKRLVPVLTGQESPVESLFPAGSFEVAQAIYGEWPMARYFNDIVATTVAAAASGQRNPPRLIEIGAGTGETTARILHVLENEEFEYWFTDVSELFLVKAEERFANAPGIHYALLDMESDFQSQGFNRGAFDVVLASNVIHTATDIGKVLSAVRSLLAPGGLVVLYESTDEPRWCDVTFGLLAGWQRYERGGDKDTPLLSIAEWSNALREAGFAEVSSPPLPERIGDLFYQNVFVARNADATDGFSHDATGRPVACTSTHEAVERFGHPGTLAPQTGLRDELIALSPGDRIESLQEHVRQSVMSILRVDASKPPSLKARLMDLGFDSLMAVELRNRLEKSLQIEARLPATLIFDFPNIDAIARQIAGMMQSDDEGGSVHLSDAGAAGDNTSMAAGATHHESARATAEELESMTEDEVEALLLKKLKGLG